MYFSTVQTKRPCFNLSKAICSTAWWAAASRPSSELPQALPQLPPLPRGGGRTKGGFTYRGNRRLSCLGFWWYPQQALIFCEALSLRMLSFSLHFLRHLSGPKNAMTQKVTGLVRREKMKTPKGCSPSQGVFFWTHRFGMTNSEIFLGPKTNLVQLLPPPGRLSITDRLPRKRVPSRLCRQRFANVFAWFCGILLGVCLVVLVCFGIVLLFFKQLPFPFAVPC